MGGQQKALIGILLIFLIIGVGTFINSRIEYAKAYDFQITEIEEQANGIVRIYHNDENYSFANYLFHESDSILVGDRLVKKADSTLLYIYRKDKLSGKYKLFRTKKPNGNFPK